MRKPIPSLPILLLACFSLTACVTAPSPPQLGGVLLQQGKPLANVQVRITSSRAPNHAIITTTDGNGQFGTGATRELRLSPGRLADGAILRIEALGDDFHAAGEVAPTSSHITCELSGTGSFVMKYKSRFRNANDIQTSLSRTPRGLVCY